MSTVFSRRSFLKYTAVAAVAVAGTSLLGGCSGAETATSTEIGGVNTVLQVRAKLNSLTVDVNTGTATFNLSIANGRRNAITVSPRCFGVKAYDQDGNETFTAYMNSSVTLKHTDGDGPQILKGKEGTYDITVTGLPVESGDTNPIATLHLIYMPDPEYNEYTSNWKITGTDPMPALV